MELLLRMIEFRDLSHYIIVLWTILVQFPSSKNLLVHDVAEPTGVTHTPEFRSAVAWLVVGT